MLETQLPDSQYLQNAESFGEYLQLLKKNGNEKKIKFAEKMFFETYYEYMEEGYDSHEALQKAIIVAICFLNENQT